jgi:signal transduction histidine kinase
MQHVATPTQAPASLRPSPRDGALWFVLVALALVTTLHYLTDVHLIPYHSIYRSLYYVPIAIAAVRYGRRGGILTALTTSALYIPHVVISWGMMPSDGFNDLLENAVFLFVGAFAGHLADAERAQRRRAQTAVAELATANVRLQEQAELAERTRAQTQSILDSLESGIVTVDALGVLARANRAAYTLLPVSVATDDVLPSAVEHYLHTRVQGFQQISAGKRTVSLHGAPLRGPQGEAVGTVLVLDDVTELRSLEEQVQRAQRLAALGRLAGGLAHEIRNPLGIVRAAAQMLGGELREDARFSEYTSVIQTEIDRVDRLIEQLLSYARPRPMSRGPVQIATLIERAVSLTRAYGVQQGVQLDTNITQDLPVVDGDTELLHQALVNLLINGIQATPRGGEVRVRAMVDLSRNGPAVVLEVRDTGRGIAEADLSRIFDPFFSTRDDGVGLGLSIVQQIVHEHNGVITVTSESGVGTVFSVRFPTPASASVHRDEPRYVVAAALPGA